MKELTRPKRPYNSKRRQAQALETRRQILAAARRLFLERGYNGATIEAIAQSAGVAVETIFAAFGNKRSLLAQLIDAAGAEEQPDLQEQNPERFLRRFADSISFTLERVAPLFEVLRDAAKTEPDMAELLRALLDRRMRNMERAAEHLRAITRLRQGMEAARAAETVWSLTSPELFNLLVRDRGWAREEYSRWLANILVRTLLV